MPRGGQGKPNIDRKSRAGQLSGAFARIDRTLKELRTHPSGAPPEKVLVLETQKPVPEFRDKLRAAVDRDPRLEWLLDAPLDDIDPAATSQLGRSWRLYLVMADYGGAREFVNKFRDYKGPEGRRGREAWFDLFDILIDVRFWGLRDRLLDNRTIDYWLEDLELAKDALRFEIELWWHDAAEKRQRAISRLRQLVSIAGGRVVHGPATIEAIHYCGLLVEIPASTLELILPSLAVAREDPERLELPAHVALLKCDEVMFFRPRVQADVVEVVGEVEEHENTIPPRPGGAPVVALFDGVPLQNHVCLSDRIIVHDPDDLAERSVVTNRRHGTAMASLIIRGDLHGDGAPLERPIVVRPVMCDNPATGHEELPDDRLALDAFHVAVRDLVVHHAAQTVKVINVSLGDRTRLFDGPGPSPWARLLDYLAYEHRLLFVVSAGNSARGFEFTGDPAAVREKQRSDRAAFGQVLLTTMYEDAAHRKLLSPAESINAITVGALHHDDGPPMPDRGQVFDPLTSSMVPAPMTSLGLGVRRAVKPDLMLPGGRQPLQEPLSWTAEQAPSYALATMEAIPLGQRVAAPGSPGRLDWAAFSRGTSNAAALATRGAARLHGVLEELRRQHPSRAPSADHDAVLLKAMLTHGARWPDEVSIWQEATKASGKELRDETARAYGYGVPDLDRVMACTERRATGIGVGELERDQAHVFQFPLPECLAGQVVRRRLVVTLAYLTPIHAGHQKYRRARLWVDLKATKDALGVATVNVGTQTASRGTLQHLVMEGEGRAVHPTTRQLELKVNCRADAGDLTSPVPFALLVTLEVAEGEALPLYQQVAERLRERARGRA